MAKSLYPFILRREFKEGKDVQRICKSNRCVKGVLKIDVLTDQLIFIITAPKLRDYIGNYFRLRI